MRDYVKHRSKTGASVVMLLLKGDFRGTVDLRFGDGDGERDGDRDSLPSEFILSNLSVMFSFSRLFSLVSKSGPFADPKLFFMSLYILLNSICVFAVNCWLSLNFSMNSSCYFLIYYISISNYLRRLVYSSMTFSIGTIIFHSSQGLSLKYCFADSTPALYTSLFNLVVPNDLHSVFTGSCSSFIFANASTKFSLNSALRVF